MNKKIRQRAGELGLAQGLTYSQFARKIGIGMSTAKGLYKDSYYNLGGSTLLKCAEYFGVEPGDLLVVEAEMPVPIAITDTPPTTDSEFLIKLWALIVSEEIIERIRQVAPHGIVAFIYEAVKEKVERDNWSDNAQPSSDDKTISDQLMVRL